MALVLLIDIIIVCVLVWLTLTKGLERTLPFFAFVVVLVPWQSQIKVPGLFDLATQRIALITLIGLYLLTRMAKPRTRSARRVPIKTLMLISIGWLLLSAANSVVPTTSLKMVMSEAIDYYLMYIILVRTITRTETIHRILFGVVAALMVCSVLGVGEARFGWYVPHWFPQIPTRFGDAQMTGGIRGIRVEATFPHPIHYGAALAIGIPLTLYLISVSRNVFRRGILWVGFFLMLYNILMTGSRGPWLALGLSLPCVFLLCRGRLRWYFPVIGLLCLVVLMGRSSVRDHLATIFDQTMNSNTQLGRSYDYRYALVSIAEHALAANIGRTAWGYGSGSFYYLGLRGPFLNHADWAFKSCDSTWVKFMVETGYVGLIVMALLLLTPAFMTFRDYLRFRQPEAQLSGVLFVNLIAFYFIMLSVSLYSWAQIGFLLWILIALALAHGQVVRHTHPTVALDSSSVPSSEFILVETKPLAY